MMFDFCDFLGIRGVLSENAKCPWCSSSKFTEEDLLPNLSLRQAMEHFLESQNQFSISENALQRFAPGRELVNNKLAGISSYLGPTGREVVFYAQTST